MADSAPEVKPTPPAPEVHPEQVEKTPVVTLRDTVAPTYTPENAQVLRNISNPDTSSGVMAQFGNPQIIHDKPAGGPDQKDIAAGRDPLDAKAGGPQDAKAGGGPQDTKAGSGPQDTKAGDSPQDKAPEVKNSETEQKQQVDDLSKQHGVQVAKGDDGRLHYYVEANGEKTELPFTTENTPEGIKQADANLRQMEADKAKEIESKYQVRIAKPGEAVGDAHTRRPTLGELAGVESALSKTQTGSPAGRIPVTFRFLDKATDGGELADYHMEQGCPVIDIQPDAAQAKPTEKDVAKANGDMHSSLEGTLIHELTHHAQDTVSDSYLPPLTNPQASPDIKPPPSGDEYSDKTINPQLGWKKIGDQSYMEGKDGNLYQYHEADKDKAGDKDHWTRCDQNGHPIDADGKPVDQDKAVQITNDEMRKTAKVTPASDYFDYPYEMHAEAEEQFVSSEASRAHLLQTNSQLYDIMKQQDQTEIDRRYPPSKSGEHLMIRSPSGELVPNTPEARKVQEEFEKRNRDAKGG